MLVKLKDIAKIVSGGTPSTKHPEYYNGEIFWFTPYDLSNNKDFKYISKSDRKITKLGFQKSSSTMIPPYNILLTSRAPIGYLAINKNECCTNQGFKSLIINKQLADIDYIYYWLKYNIKKIENLGAGTTFKELSKNNLENVEIELPSLNKQKEISKILNLIDNQIEINYNVIKRLQVMGQAIFNKFFSNENTFISLLKFPYIRIIKPGIDKFKNNKKYVATAEVDKDKMNLDSPIINFETRENRANMQPVKNSVWFAKLKNSIKHIFVSENDNLLINNYIFSTGFCGLQCENFVFEYMINYINNKYFEKRKDDLSHGATMEGINNDNLNSFIITLPKKEKLELFHNKTKKIYLQISKIINFNYRLSNLKNKLLPLLINGQIEIN